MKTIKEIINHIFHKNKLNVTDSCEFVNGTTDMDENKDKGSTEKTIITQCSDSIHEICILCLEPFI